MLISASEFKARCLALLDQVHQSGEPLVITKRGKVLARLVPAGEVEERPWERLRGTATWTGDPLAPAVDDEEVDALR